MRLPIPPLGHAKGLELIPFFLKITRESDFAPKQPSTLLLLLNLQPNSATPISTPTLSLTVLERPFFLTSVSTHKVFVQWHWCLVQIRHQPVKLSSMMIVFADTLDLETIAGKSTCLKTFLQVCQCLASLCFLLKNFWENLKNQDLKINRPAWCSLDWAQPRLLTLLQIRIGWTGT